MFGFVNFYDASFKDVGQGCEYTSLLQYGHLLHSGHLRFLKKSSLCTGVRHIEVFSYWSIVIHGVKKQHTVMGSETLIKQIITYKTLNLVLVGNIST